MIQEIPPDVTTSNVLLSVATFVLGVAVVVAGEYVRSGPAVPWFDRRTKVAETVDEIYDHLRVSRPDEDALERLKTVAKDDELLYTGSDGGDALEVTASDVKKVVRQLARESNDGPRSESPAFPDYFDTLRRDVDDDRLTFEHEIQREDPGGSRDARGSVDTRRLWKRLKEIRYQHDLQNNRRSEELAHDLLADTMSYLSGERISAEEVRQSFEAVVENLEGQKSAMGTLRRCNRSLGLSSSGRDAGSSERTASQVRETVSEAKRSLDGDDAELADAVSEAFGHVLDALDEVEELRSDLREARDERDRYRQFADAMTAQLDVEWARSQLNLPADAGGWEVVSEGTSEDLFGERVVPAAADRVADANEGRLPRGTTASELLETVRGATTDDAEAVEEAFQTAVDSLRRYSVVQNQLSTDVDAQTVEREGDSVVEQARETGVPDLEDVVEEHVGDQLDSLNVVRDVDFVTPYLVYDHLERLELVLSMLAERRSQTAPTFDDLEAKKRRIEDHFADERVNAGNKLSRHFLELAEALEAEAKEAQSAGETRKANVRADAADRLLDHVVQMYEQERLRRYLEVI